MVKIGTVAALWRYPVSSVGGEDVERLDVTRDSVVGERRFGLVDLRSGAVADPGREPRWHRSLDLSCRLDDEHGVQLRIRDGAWFDGRGVDGADRLSEFFGFPVE
jgi:uncharacterized protein YcbX